MSREWRPGDVAMVTSVNGEVDIALAVGDGDEHSGWRTSRATFWGPKYVTAARPLVVIDPEDDEQVERLAANYERETHAELTDFPQTLGQARMRQALRSLIAPPKPEEPTGLGAVVEDGEGSRYVYAPDGPDDRSPWTCRDKFGGFYGWSDIDAVKVLSQGWSA